MVFMAGNEEPKKKAYKYEMRVTVTLQSDSYPDLQRIANKYFLAPIPKSENISPKHAKGDYVAISTSKELLRGFE